LQQLPETPEWAAPEEMGRGAVEGMNMKRAKQWLGVLAVLSMAGLATGNPISLEQAETAVGNWISRGGGFGTTGTDGMGMVSGMTLDDPLGGNGRWHVVKTSHGYAVTTADDRLEPIVAFGEGDAEWLADGNHPFWMLLRADHALRAPSGTQEGTPQRRGGDEAGVLQWSDLLSTRVSRAAPNGTAAISDIRHDAMLRTKWDQRRNTYGNYRYNLYLPYRLVAKTARGMEHRLPVGEDGESADSTDGMVVDRQGDWLLRQRGKGNTKTLWLEPKRGGAGTELAHVVLPSATVTNTYWDEYAPGTEGSSGGAWVTNVDMVGCEYEFHAFVNDGWAYWEDADGETARLWTAPCTAPTDKTLLAEAPATVNEGSAFESRRWRRGAAWSEACAEGWASMRYEGGMAECAGISAKRPRRGAKGPGTPVFDEYSGSGQQGEEDDGEDTGEYGEDWEDDYLYSGSGGNGGNDTAIDISGSNGSYHIHWRIDLIKRRAPAGCVATAGGQVMNWWRAPTQSVQRVRKPCTIFGHPSHMTTKGGTYAWDKMGGAEPLSPREGLAVSKLLHDIAVACSADFEKDGTAMSSFDFVSSLTELFGYSNAKWTRLGGYDAATLQRAIVPNLDAGAPVMLSITNASPEGAHEVVVDGCGDDGGAFALHLNLGWGGYGTMWYKPPKIYPNSNQNYNFISDISYNISPTNRGEIISGRVLGPHGRPVSRPSVAIRDPAGKEVYRGTGGADGIYAWWGGAAGTYTIAAQDSSGASRTATATLKASSSTAVGNALCDVTLSEVRTVSIPTWSGTAAGAKGVQTGTIGSASRVTLSCPTAGARIHYTLDGTDPTPDSPLYDGPFIVQCTTTLKIAAFADGMESSETAEMRWTFEDTASRDDFASARPILGASGRADFTNDGYGKESGEPVHSSEREPGGASAWAKWTAPASGDWTFWLEGTSGKDLASELDTQLAVYTGTSVESLACIAANDDTPAGGLSSRISFHATEGTEYKIAMDTYGGSTGNLTLRWEEGYIHHVRFKVELNESARFVPQSGERVEVGVGSSADWRLVEYSDLVRPETTKGKDGDVFACTMATNTTGSERTGYATIQSGNSEPATLALRQHPMDFATTKEAAVERARRENKRILLVRGREACLNTQGTLFSSVPDAEVKPLVEAGYILWYSNCDRQGDGREYAGNGALPTVAILDPLDMSEAVALTNGYQSASALKALLWGNNLHARIEISSLNMTSAVASVTVRDWGAGASSANVVLERGSDAAFSAVTERRQLGTISDLMVRASWTIRQPELSERSFYRIRVASGDWEAVSETIEFVPVSLVDGVCYSPDGTTLLKYPSDKDGALFTVPATVKALADRCFAGSNLRAVLFLGDAPAATNTCFKSGLLGYYSKGTSGWTDKDENEAWGASWNGMAMYPIPEGGSEIVLGVTYHYEIVDGIVWVFVEQDDGTVRLECKPRTDGAWSGEAAIPGGVTGELSVPRQLGGKLLSRVGCFYYCNFSSIAIPDSVTYLDDGFGTCKNLTSLAIPHSVTNIAGGILDDLWGTMDGGRYGTVTNIAVESGNTAFKSVDGVLYSLDGTELVEVPPALKGLFQVPNTVTSIWHDAFVSCCDLTGVKIPGSVKHIGDGAFGRWSYEDFDTSTIPGAQLVDGWVIDGSTHTWDNRIEVAGDVDLAGIRGIVEGAFHSCTNLCSVIIPAIPSIPDSAFSGCRALTNAEIACGVESIGDYAFYGCPLKKLAIPGSVRGIGARAFYSCPDLTSLVLEEGLESIGEAAFSGGKITELTIPDTVKNIGQAAFSSCRGLETLTIGNGVTNLQDNVFYGCTNLLFLAIGNGVADLKWIPSVRRLTRVVIGAGVTNIPEETFYGCTNLTSVTIPGSVAEIGEAAFSGCTNLKEADIGSGVKRILGWAFRGCEKLVSAIIPDSVTEIGADAFSRCGNLVEASIGSGVKTIGESAFSGCGNLLEANIGSGVKSIGDFAFYRCEKMARLTIPDNVTSIGDRAFFGCSGLETLSIGNGVTNLSYLEFYDCTNLVSLSIGNGLTDLSWLPSSSRLTNVVIGNGVTNISEGAFYGCENLPSISIPGRVSEIGDSVFYGCSNLMEVGIGAGVKRIGDWAFEKCVKISVLAIPGNVTEIGYGAFYECDGLKKLYVPESWKGTDKLADAMVPEGCKIQYYKVDGKTAGTPVGVPYGWLAGHAGKILAAKGGDWEAAAKAEAENGMTVWECYWAGLEPAGKGEAFKVKSISFKGGRVAVEWEPDLNDGGKKAERAYRVYGKKQLEDGKEWKKLEDGADWKAEGWRFFKVGVEMPE
jgi:hypothetical protein